MFSWYPSSPYGNIRGYWSGIKEVYVSCSLVNSHEHFLTIMSLSGSILLKSPTTKVVISSTEGVLNTMIFRSISKQSQRKVKFWKAM